MPGDTDDTEVVASQADTQFEAAREFDFQIALPFLISRCDNDLSRDADSTISSCDKSRNGQWSPPAKIRRAQTCFAMVLPFIRNKRGLHCPQLSILPPSSRLPHQLQRTPFYFLCSPAGTGARRVKAPKKKKQMSISFATMVSFAGHPSVDEHGHARSLLQNKNEPLCAIMHIHDW